MTDTADTAPIPATIQTAAAAPAEKWVDATITLTKPVTIEGNTITKLVLAEPDVEGLEAIEDLGIVEGKNPTVKQSRHLIAIIARVSPDVILKLSRADFAAAVEALVPLLAGAK